MALVMPQMVKAKILVADTLMPEILGRALVGAGEADALADDGALLHQVQHNHYDDRRDGDGAHDAELLLPQAM